MEADKTQSGLRARPFSSNPFKAFIDFAEMAARPMPKGSEFIVNGGGTYYRSNSVTARKKYRRNSRRNKIARASRKVNRA